MYTSACKKIASVFFMAVILCSFTTVPVYQADFSGSWTLNEGKSELGQFGARMAASKMVVEQKDGTATITRTTTSFNGETVTATETLTADGKEQESTVFGSAKKKSSLKWAADGNSFTINSEINMERGGQAMQFKTAETWSLGSDGKTLTLQNAMTTPQGDIALKAVYDKQ